MKNVSNDIKNKGIWKYLENNSNNNYFNLIRNINTYKHYVTIGQTFDLLKNSNSSCIGFTLSYKCIKHLPQREIINFSENLHL